jgi:hypothetical protein
MKPHKFLQQCFRAIDGGKLFPGKDTLNYSVSDALDQDVFTSFYGA